MTATEAAGEVVAMATDLAEFLGAAVGFNLLFGMPLWVAGLVTALLLKPSYPNDSVLLGYIAIVFVIIVVIIIVIVIIIILLLLLLLLLS